MFLLILCSQSFSGIIFNIRNPDNRNNTLAQESCVHPFMIQTDERSEERLAFGCPVTITVYFKPTHELQ